jgi:hypothetical protein
MLFVMKLKKGRKWFQKAPGGNFSEIKGTSKQRNPLSFLSGSLAFAHSKK